MVPPTYVRYFKSIIRNSIRKSDKIITVSKSVKQELINDLHLKPDKIKVCEIGITEALPQINSDKKIEKVLLYYNLDKKKYFLFVGRLEKRKNLHKLIIAMANFIISNEHQ
jgi:glycosyltransferase involved in cell wall biosynthesis